MRESSSEPPTGRWTRAEKIVGLTWLALAVLLSFPVYAVANHGEPVVLGLPPGLWWIVLWTLVATIVVFAAYRREYRKGSR